MEWTELDERKILLKRYFGYLWKEKDERDTILEELGLSEDSTIDKVAEKITHEQLINLFTKYCTPTKPFRGKYYTVTHGDLFLEGSWDEVYKLTEKAIKEGGKGAYAILKTLLEFGRWNNENYWDFVTEVEKISGKDISEKVLEKLKEYGLIEDFDRGIGNVVPLEIYPVVKRAVERIEVDTLTTQLSTKIAEAELGKIYQLDKEFEDYLEKIDIEETLEFGKNFSATHLVNYLKNIFGKFLYFDLFLSILQQYSLADVPIKNPNKKIAGYIGFNLAFLGQPGTGKTFAVDDLIRGNVRLGVPPHGLPGRNRYCGGMTPAKLIRIGEAYEGRKFNFIVPEFNDWFKYKGMVEPLKLAMEQREVKYEIKAETVGPYKFNSFFAVNYNTKMQEKGYQSTISDPNFNAIEDRMLCRLHRMTKERFMELRKSQRKLRLGKMDFSLAKKIRDHLALVYAIETKHKKVREIFPYKIVVIDEEIDEMLEKADMYILDELDESQYIAFSARLADRAVRLACGMSLLNYFNCERVVEVKKEDINLALKFYVEEVAMREQEIFEPRKVLKKLGIE